jgi:endonuclease/exonuclease/phosphatase family metal-dependent hydrolase
MNLITWNIQWARGIDGEVDPARIARTAGKLADFDLLCLQEVAVNFPGLPGSRGENQVAELSRELPDYSAYYGAAIDVDDGKGGRSLFGNVIFSRLPVIQIYRHLLPRPVDGRAPSMQRIVVEAVVATPCGPVRVLTTHLEYYSAMQRMAQVDALRALHHEACGHAAASSVAADANGPFRVLPRPAAAILCGDFNCQPQDPAYRRIGEPFSDGMCPSFVDAWTLTHPGEPHAPSAGLYENSWAAQPLCCDFIFVTADLAPRVRRLTVDARTQASDHQPVLIELADR